MEDSGEAMGVIDLPSDLDVHEIGETYVLGRWRDELDVELVRMCGLVRGTGP